MGMKEFGDVVDVICREDGRYEKAAYFFVRQALDFTFKSLTAGSEKKAFQGQQLARHLSGPELLEGIRSYAIEQYGPMSKTLLDQWGIRKCEDFGDIVFNLVDYGVLGKTENDSKADFAGGYNFRTAFVKPFEPAEKPPSRRRSNSAKRI